MQIPKLVARRGELPAPSSKPGRNNHAKRHKHKRSEPSIPQAERVVACAMQWIPAFAGMTTQAAHFGRIESGTPWMNAFSFAMSSGFSLPVKSGMPRSLAAPPKHDTLSRLLITSVFE